MTETPNQTKAPRSDRGRPRGMRAGSIHFETLAFLANNGPTLETDVLDHAHETARSIRGEKATNRSGYHAFRKLEELGLVAVKVWLTPKGLEELKRLGWVPQLTADADVTEESPA
jgi:hypothetical protein